MTSFFILLPFTSHPMAFQTVGKQGFFSLHFEGLGNGGERGSCPLQTQLPAETW